MKSIFVRRLPLIAAGGYLAWALFVYLGTYGREPHSWWPIFLYHMTLPWSWIYESGLDEWIRDIAFGGRDEMVDSDWLTMDHFAGVYYVVVGTLWYGILGLVVRSAIVLIQEKKR